MYKNYIDLDENDSDTDLSGLFMRSVLMPSSSPVHFN